MTRERTCLALLCILVSTTAALAGNAAPPDTSQQTYSIGMGNQSCGQFLVETAALDWITPDGNTRGMDWQGKMWFPNGAVFEQWVLGYVTASDVEVTRPDQVIKMDRESIMIAVRKVCGDHPDEILASAASRYLVSQRRAQKRHATSPR
jgi:hypothetical protein